MTPTELTPSGPAPGSHGPAPPDLADFESEPLTRPEYITALVHLYRGELARTIAWRVRLDATTNWAIITAAGVLTFVFGQGQHSHWPLLMGLPIIGVFHGLEARRFRMWHVWGTRLRVIEENFYAPLLRRDLASRTRHWGRLIAEDLFRPRFKLGRLDALRARLVRNYWALYGALIIAWLAKVFLWRTQSKDLYESLAAGSEVVPWWVGPALLGIFVVGLVALFLYRPTHPDADIDYFEHTKPREQSRLDL